MTNLDKIESENNNKVVKLPLYNANLVRRQAPNDYGTAFRTHFHIIDNKNQVKKVFYVRQKT